jgi:hypothetical protein
MSANEWAAVAGLVAAIAGVVKVVLDKQRARRGARPEGDAH